MVKEIHWYREQGFSFFPLPEASKKPFIGWNWKVFQSRLPTRHEVETWFSGARRYNVAVITGAVSGNLAVLDFDVPELFDEWERLANLETTVVRTGKGFHVYVCLLGNTVLRNGNFQVQGRHAGQFRFDGGYVVAPPSVHPSGRFYEWQQWGNVALVSPSELRITQAETPKGLAILPTSRTQTGETRKPSQGIHAPERYAEEAVRRECEKIQAAVPGTRNTALFTAALKTWKYCSVLQGDKIYGALVTAGKNAGLSEEEARVTVAKAWNTARY